MSRPRDQRPRLEQALRESAKSMVRGYGVATAGLRPLPSFLVIGAKRGGSTSVWRYLQEHPGVLHNFPAPEKIKGTYFFDENYSRGERWYRSHFPSKPVRARASKRLGYEVAVGEASPYYLYHPLAPQRAAQVVPEAIVIALLRHPADRAFSHYKERRKNGTETLSFEDALDAEAGRLAGEEERIIADPTYKSFAHRHQSYVAQSRYLPMLERWAAAFPPEQLVIEVSEEFYADPQPVMDRVTGLLGLPRHELENPEQFNAEPDEIDPSTRDRLAALFESEIAALAGFLGRDLPW